MYKIKIKALTITLNTKETSEVTKPSYLGQDLLLKNRIENSYNEYGHTIGQNYSADELEFTLNQLNINFLYLENDLKINKYLDRP